MANSAEEILGALRSSIVALGDLESPVANDPYVADAKSFATQAAVCVEKHMVANGMEVPEDPNAPALMPLPEPPPAPEQSAPAKETRRDRDKTA